MTAKCPFCDLDGCEIVSFPIVQGGSNYTCKNCGRFFLTGTQEGIINNKESMGQPHSPEQKAIISHTIWNMQKDGIPIDIDLDEILKNEKLPNPAEQADNAILWFGSHSQNPADYQNIYFLHFAAKIGTFSDIRSVCYILKILWDKEFIESAGNVNPENVLGNKPQDAHMKFRLKSEGWEKYEALKRGRSDSKKAFMAMPFKGVFKEKVYEHFKKAAEQEGFQLCNPLLDKPQAGLIDVRLRVEIREAKFLVADLTGDNLGVYWEAGVAEGLGKKVIYTCEKEFYEKNKIHFDTNHLQTIKWEEDNLDEASEDLKSVIRNTFPSDAKMQD